MGDLLVALLLLWATWWVLAHFVPGPSRVLVRVLRRSGRGLWSVAYRTPALQRGRAFGLFWLGCIIWSLMFIAMLAEAGRGLAGLFVFGLFLIIYRVMLGWWERRAAARVQRPLPHREQW